MKIRNKFLIVFISFFAIALSFACFGFSHKVSFAAEEDNWCVLTGDTGNTPSVTADADGYYKIENLKFWRSSVNSDRKLITDGLTVSIKVSGYDNMPLGFGFTNTADGYSPVSDMFNATLRTSADWNLLYYQYDHTGEFGSPTHDIAFYNSNLSDSTWNYRYGIDGNRRYGFNKATEFDFSIKFEKEGSVYKLTTSGSAYSDRNSSNVCYVSDYYVPTTAYLCVWALDGNNADISVKYTETGSYTPNDQTAEGEDLSGDNFFPEPIVTLAENGYIKIEKLDNWDYGVYSKNKVKIDGLTLNYKVTGYNGCPIGFGLSTTDTVLSPLEGKFNATIRPVSSTPYLYYQSDHSGETISPPYHHIAYKNPELTDTSYGADGAQRYKFTNYSSFEFSVKFEKFGDVYKITTNGISNFASAESNVCYVSKNYIPDEAYVCIWGVEGGRHTIFVKTDPSFIVEPTEPENPSGPTEPENPEDPTTPKDEEIKPDKKSFGCFSGIETASYSCAMAIIVAFAMIFIRKVKKGGK